MLLNLKSFLIIISFVFVVNTKPFDPVFDIGVYPNHKKYGINDHRCGLWYPPVVHHITFKPWCFQQNFSDQIIYENRGKNRRFRRNAETQPEGRIFRGQDAQRGEAPWAVYIGWKTMLTQYVSLSFCTGSLITHEWVLTAAHCKNFEDPGFHGEGRYVVIAGPTRYGGLGYIYGDYYRDNAKFIAHPYWDDPSLATELLNETSVENIKNFYDVSLIKLDKPFSQIRDKDSGSYLINTVCLPSRNRSKGFPFKVTNYGYGLIESPTTVRNVRAQRLKKAEYDILRDSHGIYTVIHAKGEPKTCLGDGGSGIVYYLDEYKTKGVIVGTYQESNRRAFPSGEYIKTDCRSADFDWSKFVATYKIIDWILDTIANN